ncbi:MAG TPA: transcriptional regulator [Dehalococcoidia bacterium]|jgi:DNA-binding MarR family transcriptional regulator|nr:transcriptional regulator [Dehalococcoidia bacterium]
MNHPRTRLDEIIHQPVRFSIMATLAAADEVEFGFLRDAVEVSDSLLSRQLTLLEQAGYVHIRKGYVGKRPRTWLSLTEEGRAAFTAHVSALQEIVAQAGSNGMRRSAFSLGTHATGNT